LRLAADDPDTQRSQVRDQARRRGRAPRRARDYVTGAGKEKGWPPGALPRGSVHAAAQPPAAAGARAARGERAWRWPGTSAGSSASPLKRTSKCRCGPRGARTVAPNSAILLALATMSAGFHDELDWHARTATGQAVCRDRSATRCRNSGCLSAEATPRAAAARTGSRPEAATSIPGASVFRR